MKRFLLTLITLCILSSSVIASETEDSINNAISLYKSGKYSECIKILDTISEKDSYPVIYYYLGLSYAKSNNKKQAIENYDRVIALSTDKTLKSMAKTAKDCLGTSGFTAIDAQLSITNDSKAERFIKQETPKNEKIKEEKVVQNQKKEIKSSDKMPTNSEIGEAIMILKKAGLWNGGGIDSIAQKTDTANQQNQQDMMAKMYMQQMTQQMNNPAYLMMSLNGNNNNGMNSMNMMNMLPFLMNNNSDGNSNPAANQQFLQTMMMSQMMPNFDFTSSNNK